MGRVQGSRNKGKIIFKETKMLVVLTWVDKLSVRKPEDKPSLKINNFEWKMPPRPHSMYPRDYTSFLWCWNQSRCLLAFIPGCNSCKVEDSQPKLVSYLLLLWESLISSNGKEGIKGKGTGKRRNWKNLQWLWVVITIHAYIWCIYAYIHMCIYVTIYHYIQIDMFTNILPLYMYTYIHMCVGVYMYVYAYVYI